MQPTRFNNYNKGGTKMTIEYIATKYRRTGSSESDVYGGL